LAAGTAATGAGAAGAAGAGAGAGAAGAAGALPSLAAAPAAAGGGAAAAIPAAAPAAGAAGGSTTSALGTGLSELAAVTPTGAPPLLSAMGPPAGTLSPAVTAGLETATPLTSAGAAGPEAIMAGANPATSFGTAATTPTAGAESGDWLSKIAGYSKNPYVQELFKTGLQKAEGEQGPQVPMSPFVSPQMPVVSPMPENPLDKLAWLRAFNIQG
jgi:hypothetical protein